MRSESSVPESVGVQDRSQESKGMVMVMATLRLQGEGYRVLVSGRWWQADSELRSDGCCNNRYSVLSGYVYIQLATEKKWSCCSILVFLFLSAGW